MPKNTATLVGNLLVFTLEGDLTVEEVNAQLDRAREILKTMPVNLRAVYDARNLKKVGIPEAMAYQKFIAEELENKVVKGAGVAPDNALFGFLGKMAFSLSKNHKLFYSKEYERAMDWVKT